MTTPAIQIAAISAVTALPQDAGAMLRDGQAMTATAFDNILAGVMKGVDASTETVTTQTYTTAEATALKGQALSRPLMLWQAQEIEASEAMTGAEAPAESDGVAKPAVIEASLPDLKASVVEAVSEAASASVQFDRPETANLSDAVADIRAVGTPSLAPAPVKAPGTREASVKSAAPADALSNEKVVAPPVADMPMPRIEAEAVPTTESAPKAQKGPAKKVDAPKTEGAEADVVKAAVVTPDTVIVAPVIVPVTADATKVEAPERLADPMAKVVKAADVPSDEAQAALVAALDNIEPTDEDAPKLAELAARATRSKAKAQTKETAPVEVAKDAPKEALASTKLTSLLANLSSGLTTEIAPANTPVQSTAPAVFQPQIVADSGLKFAPATHKEATAQTYSPSQLAQHTIENIATLSAQITRKVGQKTTTFDMELRPTDMGRVEVKLEIGTDGKLSAALNFDSPMTESQFRDRQDDLRRQLEQAGFQLEDGALSFSSREQGQRREHTQADTDTNTNSLIGAQIEAEGQTATDPTLYAHLNAGLYGGAQTLSLSVLV
ncbi:flagellar hook-length control protein FliK [Asticcacaulis sp. YBE204]|uniref:flagellar hook-length control protein FliK n=1 Tax=Asticcacaulis sp. YBE204 TaxID=1282363 RepID=UPI00041E510D|nr:flagellar hook-length control protein FliK [Asticcacaulis sp. YBE204]